MVLKSAIFITLNFFCKIYSQTIQHIITVFFFFAQPILESIFMNEYLQLINNWIFHRACKINHALFYLVGRWPEAGTSSYGKCFRMVLASTMQECSGRTATLLRNILLKVTSKSWSVLRLWPGAWTCLPMQLSLRWEMCCIVDFLLLKVILSLWDANALSVLHASIRCYKVIDKFS